MASQSNPHPFVASPHFERLCIFCGREVNDYEYHLFRVEHKLLTPHERQLGALREIIRQLEADKRELIDTLAGAIGQRDREITDHRNTFRIMEETLAENVSLKDEREALRTMIVAPHCDHRKQSVNSQGTTCDLCGLHSSKLGWL